MRKRSFKHPLPQTFSFGLLRIGVHARAYLTAQELLRRGVSLAARRREKGNEKFPQTSGVVPTGKGRGFNERVINYNADELENQSFAVLFAH